MNLLYLTRIFVIVLVHIYAMRAPLQKPVFLHIQIYLVITVVRLPAAGKDRGVAEVTPFLRLYVGISCACISKIKIEPVLLIQLIFYRHLLFRCHIINGEFDAVVILIDSEFYSIIVKEFGIIQINIQHLTLQGKPVTMN